MAFDRLDAQIRRILKSNGSVSTPVVKAMTGEHSRTISETLKRMEKYGEIRRHKTMSIQFYR